MRVVIFSILFYAAVALAPAPPPIPTQAATVVSAAKFLKGTAKPAGKQRRHRRKRVRRVVYRKPPTVIATPDVVQVLTMREWEREQAARRFAAMVWWWF